MFWFASVCKCVCRETTRSCNIRLTCCCLLWHRPHWAKLLSLKCAYPEWFQLFQLSSSDTTALAPCADLTAATFDGSAAYLAVGGAQVQIYNIVKGKFPELAQLSDTQKVGTACLTLFMK